VVHLPQVDELVENVYLTSCDGRKSRRMFRPIVLSPSNSPSECANVRPIPPSNPFFPHLYGRRNDAESINRGVVDSLYLGRAHSVGHQRQHANLLGYALMVNSLSLFLHGRRVSSPLPGAA
jgi:hypothetical protein